MDTNIALAGLSSGGARQLGAEYGRGVHDAPPGCAWKHCHEKYVWTPIFLTTSPHHDLVWSYPWYDFVGNFPIYPFYQNFALNGQFDWVIEQPELQQLYEQALGTVHRETQQALIRQMERHTHEQAYFLFLYNPIKLYAVNKAVEFVPHVTTILNLTETSVTEQHWSVRKQKTTVQE